MASPSDLPPGVSQELFSILPKNTFFYDGAGQAGNWSDPHNWWAGAAPDASSLVVVPLSATLNGSFIANTVMMLGTETVTVNGVLSTTNTNLCESFMVCNGAVANFTATSVLNDAGAIIVGNEDVGVLTAVGTASQYSSLTTLNAKIGRLDGGIGTVTIDGAHWTNSLNLFVGLQGNGTLNVLDGGQVKAGADMRVGQYAGSVGVVTLSSGATLSVVNSLNLGAGPNSPVGSGSATVHVDSGALLSVGSVVNVFANENLFMAGGTLALGSSALDLRVMPGGELSGYGLVNSGGGSIIDAGTITAAGGNLTLQSNVIAGAGVMQVETGATLTITASQLGEESISFLGSGATLSLAEGVVDNATITGFGAGDRIVMPDVDQIAWNGSLGVLVLKDEGQVVDRLHFAGMTGANPFALSQAGGGALITISSGH